MTRKEQLKMNALLAENAALKDEITNHFRVYGDLLGEKISLQTRLDTIHEVLNWSLGAELLEVGNG